MSREYKFRGKSIKEFGNNLIGTWFYGGIITNPHGKEMHIGYFDKDMLSWRNVPVDPETVGEYTGLKDKNGKEIYEGDIVKGRYWEKGEAHRHVGKVTYVMSAFKVRGINKYSGMDDELSSVYEVIGNVWENPNLLETK